MSETDNLSAAEESQIDELFMTSDGHPFYTVEELSKVYSLDDLGKASELRMGDMFTPAGIANATLIYKARLAARGNKVAGT